MRLLVAVLFISLSLGASLPAAATPFEAPSEAPAGGSDPARNTPDGQIRATPPISSDLHYVAYKDRVPSGFQPGQTVGHGRIVRISNLSASVTVEVPPGRDLPSEIRDDPNVKYVERDLVGKFAYTPNDPEYSQQGGLTQIGAPAAWDRTRGSTSVDVAVLDTGLDRSHPEFAYSRFQNGYNYGSGNTDTTDRCGHGNEVTGVLAAQMDNAQGIAGLAQVTIHPYKVHAWWNLCPDIYSSAAADAIRAAADNGMDVISASWIFTSYSQALADAIDYAIERNVVIVAAAGNDNTAGSGCGVQYPWVSRPDDVIIVGSMLYDKTVASGACSGSQIDLVARWDSKTTGLSGYLVQSGTSISTPFVSGAAALLKSIDWSCTPSKIQSRLIQTSEDLGPAGRDNDFGWGLLRIDTAIADSGCWTGYIKDGTFSTGTLSAWTQTGAGSGCTFTVTYSAMTSVPSGYMRDPSSSVACSLKQTFTRLEADRVYHFHAVIQVVSGNAPELYLQWKDATGAIQSVLKAAPSGINPVRISGVAPTGATSLDAMVYYATGSVGEAVIDDVSLVAVVGKESLVSLTNANFEDSTCVLLDAWRCFGQGYSGCAHTWTTDWAYSGSRSLRIQDTLSSSACGVYQTVGGSVGAFYSVSLRARLLSGAGIIYIQWMNGETVISSETAVVHKTTPGGTGGINVGVGGHMPSGANAVRVWYYSSTAGTMDSYVDNVQLLRWAPTP